MEWGDLAKQVISLGAPMLGTALGGPLGGIAGEILARTIGAAAAMPARRPATRPSPCGHRRVNASPNDDACMGCLRRCEWDIREAAICKRSVCVSFTPSAWKNRICVAIHRLDS